MKRSTQLFFGALITSFIAGTLFFCIYQEWLVIYWNKPYTITRSERGSQKKMITLYRSHHDEWTTETVELLIPPHEQDGMKVLINAWLSWLTEEQVFSKKVQAESVLYSPSGYEMYLSFDQTPFASHWSIRQREQFLNALLKTLKENGCTASLVYFLVHHKPLHDTHLDFSQAWSLQQHNH